MPDLRPMTAADADAVAALQHATFSDLGRRMHEPPRPAPEAARARGRIVRCVESTPEGAWVATEGERIVGAAAAIVREGLWGLSLLVVDPERQSAGTGRALLAAALACGDGARGGLILASNDARALRAYQRAGFTLRPTFDSGGAVRAAPVRPETVREGRWPEDRDLCDAASRAVRGAAHGDDLETPLAAGDRLLVDDRGGFAACGETRVHLLAATEEAIARDLLRAALADRAGVERVTVDFLDAANAWAVEEVVAAGLDLVPGGAIAVRGDVGPMRPYLPSGAWL